jgi:hypothetical protein
MALVGPGRVVAPAEAALFSSFTTSQIRCFAGGNMAGVDDGIRSEVHNLLELLR